MARLSAMALLLSGTKRVVAEAGPVYLLFCLVYPCLDDLMPRLVLAHGRRVRAIQQAETRAGGQTRSGEPESQRKPRGRGSSDAAALFYVSTSTLFDECVSVCACAMDVLSKECVLSPTYAPTMRVCVMEV